MPRTPPRATAPRPRILLVDDCVTSLLVEEYLLAGFQCDVVKATGGEEALRLLGRGGVDLVVLDLVMPGMSGLETLRRIRRHMSPGLPVVMVTVRGDPEHRNEAQRLGASGYLTKPVGQSDLLREISRLLAGDPAVEPTHGGPARGTPTLA